MDVRADEITMTRIQADEDGSQPDAAPTTPVALQRIGPPKPIRLDRLTRDCEAVAADVERLGGPGAAAVRSAARALVMAIELYEQQRRRIAAEVLRE